MGGIGTQLTGEAKPFFFNSAKGLRNVRGEANRLALVVDGAADRLPDPMGCVGGKSESFFGVESLGGLHEADGTFLDEVFERDRAAAVGLGDVNHESHVRLDQT